MYGRRPLSRLEAGLYAAAAGVLLAVFLWQLLDYMEIAERAAMNATLTNLTSELNTRAAYELMSRGRTVSDWSKRNPFELGQFRAPNYAGEVDSNALNTLPSAGWAYDPASAELIYVPRLATRLRTADPNRVLRFRVQRKTAGMGYLLQPVAAYRWE